ncbi:patatin-like phospholipase family protein [Halomonas sp. M20]|uniref:patatin-like phospholipase family protein n=1 Tax=Halomonas sp. M20 TaxID=2763264 RepID=UPI001D0B856C|nr:patatin-like phospholipase family protein [Halomonas sp. M20]
MARKEEGLKGNTEQKRTDEERHTALVLQGGGALGAYQAGAYEALIENGYTPNWVAGISIGSINAAIIAGNPPSERIEKLRTFWEKITATLNLSAPSGDFPRGLFNAYNAWAVMVLGASSFFKPRFPQPLLQFSGAQGATSFYDTSPLRDTLEALVDFDRIQAGETRLSLGAVNIETGNFVYFDNTRHRIGPEHVMASGALPPALPPVEIDGEFYWDGGLVSNTPLSHVLHQSRDRDILIFQIDLWNARGSVPRNLLEVQDRQKEIIYSSRTRTVTDVYRRELELRRAIATISEHLPEGVRRDPALRDYLALGERRDVDIVHLVYKRKRYESQAKDFQFSRVSMEEHWQDGYQDVTREMSMPGWLEPNERDGKIRVFDPY